jgi:hypothetical protein
MLTVQNLIKNQALEKTDATIRSVRATLHHLNGETSEIVMLIPRYTNWGEYVEEANCIITEYVNRLTRHWVQISHYETEIGKYNANGEFIASFPAWEMVVPVDQVYAEGTSGKWVRPEEHPHYPNYGMGKPGDELSRILKIVAERKEEVYNKINGYTTLVGVPERNKAFYFPPNSPDGNYFLLNNQRYVTVYTITHVNSADQGKQHN